MGYSVIGSTSDFGSFGTGSNPVTPTSSNKQHKTVLDINTPKGQKTLKQERRAMSLYGAEHPGLQIIETPKEGGAKVDGILMMDGEVRGVYEVKCRTMTLNSLDRFGTWLITSRKIEDLRKASKLLGVPGYGMLYLVDDDMLCVWEITDKHGTYIFEFDTKRTRTQKTVNGGVAFRHNAFLPVRWINEIIEG